MTTKLMLIALGGGGGAVLRYLIAAWGQRLTEGTFPLGTMLVNVSGCLLIGLGAAVFNGPLVGREELRMALLIGVLGGYTTFSTFGYETLMAINDGQFGRAALNVVVTNALALLAVWLGYRVGTQFFGMLRP